MIPEARSRAGRPCLEGSESRNRLSGNTHAVGASTGTVVEIGPPHGPVDFWCANGALTSPAEFLGHNFLFIIKDIGNGVSRFDEVATNGDVGLTCAAGPGGPFEPVLRGDF